MVSLLCSYEDLIVLSKYLPLWVADFGMKTPQVLLNLLSDISKCPPFSWLWNLLYYYATYFRKMYMVMNLCTSFGGKKLFSAEKRDELMGQEAHHAVTSLALSRQGNVYRPVSLYIGDVKICSVRRAKGGCVCFAALGQGATCTFLLSLVFLIGKVQCRETKVHFLFTLSLIRHDQYPSNQHCFQIWLLNLIYRSLSCI